MKEFEKWLENNDDKVGNNLCFYHPLDPVWDAAELGWRAALEWAKSRSVHGLISVNEIKEELEELNERTENEN